MADELEDKEEVTEEVEKTPEEIESERSSKEEIDYEALAKAEAERAESERTKREEAEALIVKNKRIEKRHEEVDVEEDEEKPLTARELTSILARERQATQKELQEARAIEIARANTATEAEAQAALAYWKNRVNPTGSLEEDVKFAIGGLNYKRTLSKNSELSRALKAKDMASSDVAGTHRDAPTGSEPKLSAQDSSAYKSAGFEWDGKLRLYKKPINKGKKHVFKDHKSGRSWVA